MRLFRPDLPRPRGPLVDVHVHLGPSDTGELYYPLLRGDEYLELMEAAGVVRAYAFSPLRDSYLEANRELRDWAATTGDRVRAFARLGGARVPVTTRALWQVRRAANARLRGRPPDVDDLDGYAGVKMLPHLDGLPDRDVLDEIGRRGLPVLVHGGVHVPPDWIERRLVPHVTGPLIVGHLGAFPCGEQELREAVRLAGRYDHVFLETSGAWLSEFVRHAAATVPTKLLFGSDAPLAHPLAAWYHVASAVRDDAVLDRIAAGNAKEIGLW